MPSYDYDPEFDANVLETGLPSNFDGTIEGSEFVHDPDIGDGEPLIMRFTLKSHDGDVPDQLMKVKTGKGWEAVDGGRGADREDGRRANFHQSSGMGLILAALVEAGGNLNEICKQKKCMPWGVEFWDGMTLHWTRQVHDYGGEIGKIDKLLPAKIVNYGGKGGSESKGVSKPAEAVKGSVKKSAGKAANSTGGVVEVSGVELKKDMFVGLFDLAYNAESYEDFQSQAYDNETYAADDNAITAIEDAGDEGIWGQAVEKFNADTAE